MQTAARAAKNRNFRKKTKNEKLEFSGKKNKKIEIFEKTIKFMLDFCVIAVLFWHKVCCYLLILHAVWFLELLYSSNGLSLS